MRTSSRYPSNRLPPPTLAHDLERVPPVEFRQLWLLVQVLLDPQAEELLLHLWLYDSLSQNMLKTVTNSHRALLLVLVVARPQVFLASLVLPVSQVVEVVGFIPPDMRECPLTISKLLLLVSLETFLLPLASLANLLFLLQALTPQADLLLDSTLLLEDRSCRCRLAGENNNLGDFMISTGAWAMRLGLCR